MKKIVSLAVLSLAILPVAAQDTYENARLLGSDLNGTVPTCLPSTPILPVSVSSAIVM